MTCGWIAVDWGTSNLRAWAMDADGSVLAAGSSGDGMAGLAREEFEGRLLAVVGGWLGEGPTPVVACGMVGSRQGWVEAPYATVPRAPRGAPVTVATADPRLDMHILPGLRQPDPADVMRGEETQIAGFMARNPGFEGTLCLPGTHSKWADIAGGEVRRFHTVMTGEIFALLSKSSVLRHSVAGSDDEDDDDLVFEAAVAESLAAPECLPARLFSLRAADLLAGTDPVSARSRLSGLLIGAELAAMRCRWTDTPVALLGAPRLGAFYARALAVGGACPAMADGAQCTLDGLTAAYKEFVA